MSKTPESADGETEHRPIDEVIPFDPSDPAVWMDPTYAEELRQQAMKEAREADKK